MPLVADVMSTKTISVPRGASIDVAIDLMVENNISAVPVVDEYGSLAGIISEYDVLELYGRTADGELRTHACADYMTSQVRTIQQNASLEVAAKIFQAASLRRLIVLEGEKFIGILSRRDVVRSIRDGRLSLAAR